MKLTKDEKKQRENARRRAADAAGVQLAASAVRCPAGHVELDVAALFACAKGPQSWVVVCLEDGASRVTLSRAFLRRVARTIKRRPGLRLYYEPRSWARLCIRFTSTSGVVDGGGLNLTDQCNASQRFEPGDVVTCVVAGNAMLRAS